MRIGRAGDAFGLNARIDGPGKGCVFNEATGLAGIILQALTLAGILDPAFIHSENKTRWSLFNDRLFVDRGVKPELQGCFQSFQARVFG